MLETRQLQPELMDQPGLDAEAHRHALAGLARVNWWSRSAAIFWPQLERLAKSKAGPVRVLDIACGGGDVTVALARRAATAGLQVSFVGVDMSETALDVARDRAREARVEIDFRTLNVLEQELPTDCDAVICSLFLHHLDAEDAVSLLRRMSEATRQVVLVNDLIRSPIGYWLAVLGTRLLTRSHIVHVDGPLSVAGAFTLGEVCEMADRAGLSGVALQTHWPWRYLMSWSRS